MNLRNFVGLPLVSFLILFFSVIMLGTIHENFFLIYGLYALIITTVVLFILRKRTNILINILIIIMIISLTFFTSNVKSYMDEKSTYDSQIEVLKNQNIKLEQQNAQYARYIDNLNDFLTEYQNCSVEPTIVKVTKVRESPIIIEDTTPTHYESYEKDEEDDYYDDD